MNGLIMHEMYMLLHALIVLSLYVYMWMFNIC